MGPRERLRAVRGTDARDRLRQVLLTGVAITLPVAVTLLVLAFVGSFLVDVFSPLVTAVETNPAIDPTTRDLFLYALTFGLLFGLILVVGVVAETRLGSRLEATFDEAIARIPAVGSVYTSFDRMSEMLLDDNADSFQEVVLVEYPTAGSYAIAFVTADPPDVVVEATPGTDVRTVFVPMAPNPVMGGFVLQVDASNVRELDMTVEQGLRAIVTSGVAIAESDDGADPLEIGDSLPVDLTDGDGDDGDVGDGDADGVDRPDEAGDLSSGTADAHERAELGEGVDVVAEANDGRRGQKREADADDAADAGLDPQAGTDDTDRAS